jgi:hypothetical protein
MINCVLVAVGGGGITITRLGAPQPGRGASRAGRPHCASSSRHHDHTPRRTSAGPGRQPRRAPALCLVVVEHEARQRPGEFAARAILRLCRGLHLNLNQRLESFFDAGPPASSKTSQVVLYRGRVARGLIACVALTLLSLIIKSAVSAPEDEVRATFDRFVVAQNAHDIKAVELLLLGSPDFLWITRGTPVWGPDAAIKRFAVLYEGTRRESSSLKITMIGDGVAQVYVPIMFTIGAPAQPPHEPGYGPFLPRAGLA